jgi:hypothetical protein
LYSNLTSSCLFSPNSILKKCLTVAKLSIVVSFKNKIGEIKMENIYRKNKSNVDLFESYALQLVSGMLLYERIKLQQKKRH